MKVSIQKLPKSKVELTIEIEAVQFNKFYEKAILNLGKDFEIEGFRKGKAPREILEKNINSSKVLNIAAQEAVEENYKKVIFENKIEPVSKPEVEILKVALGNPFEFKVKVSVIPKIKLPDYKKIVSKFKKAAPQGEPRPEDSGLEKVFVSEKEIDDIIFQLQSSRAKFTTLERPAKVGDFIEIEYSISLKNKVGIEKFKDSFLLGKGKFIPGFEENLENMKKNEEKEFSLIFPKSHSRKDLSGNKVDFKVKMISLKKMELPEISALFLQSLGKFKTVSDLRKNIEENLRKEKTLAQKEKRKSEILEVIAKDCSFEIPEILVISEKEKLLEDFKREIKNSNNLSFEEYLKKSKKDEKEIEKHLFGISQKRVKNFLILREIGKEEKIFVSDNELEDKMRDLSKNYKNEKGEKLDFEKLKDYYRSIMFTEKVFEKLLF